MGCTNDEQEGVLVPSTIPIGAINRSEGQASQFLTGFFGDYLNEQGGYIALCSARSGQIWEDWRQEFYSDRYFAQCRVAELNALGRDVYFGVNPVASPSRKQTAIKHVMRLHVDADFKDSTGLNRLLKLEPAAVIASGTKHRYHAYFNFEAPVCARRYGEDVKKMNRRLAGILGLRAESSDLSRTLRIPGTTNFKNPKNPRPVEIVEWGPERRYTLEQCAELTELKLCPQTECEDSSIITADSELAGGRGKYLTTEQRQYLHKLLQEGLFEQSSRNDAMLLLIRHFYGHNYGEEEIARRVIEFFERRNKGLSKEWNEKPDSVRSKVRIAVNNWFRKAYPAYKKKAERKTIRLGRQDEVFIQRQKLSDRDKLFLRDALTWILNNKRDDNLVLSVRQMTRFTNCNLANYKYKREILYRLGIIEFALEHDRKAGLATEYKVLYQFSPPRKATRGGRRRSSEDSLVEEVDKMLLTGASNQQIRRRYPSFTRQRIHNRRKRLDEAARRR